MTTEHKYVFTRYGKPQAKRKPKPKFIFPTHAFAQSTEVYVKQFNELNHLVN